MLDPRFVRFLGFPLRNDRLSKDAQLNWRRLEIREKIKALLGPCHLIVNSVDRERSHVFVEDVKVLSLFWGRVDVESVHIQDNPLDYSRVMRHTSHPPAITPKEST